MSWQKRIRPEIILTSPNGNVFTAFWRKNTTPQSKKIGIFNYPKINGSVTQDLGINSATYPMIIYFEGVDNDIEAERFQAALNESGPWIVIHPVLGEKILQPLSFSPNIDPVESGNISVINTEWIEPISDAVIGSVGELAAKIQEQQNVFNAQISGQFSEITKQETVAETLAVAEASVDALTAYNEFLQDLAEVNADINAQVSAIKQEINNTIVQPVINTQSLVGQFQELIELPALVINDVGARLSRYIDFVTAIISGDVILSPDTITKNKVATQEMVILAAMRTIGSIAITGDFQTRPEAIQAAVDINNIYIDIINALDTSQVNFSNNPADNQYFSQSQTFSDSSLLISYISAYLLKISLDLKIEKRFILKKDRAPIEITISEYGNLGENDNNFDLFIASNNLKSDEIILLPSGREVVIYV